MDKIFVSEFIKDIEIGAYQSERGCTQRVRFDVILEIFDAGQSLNDDVDRVLSYELILECIDDLIRSQRFNLLETLGEKIAESCLSEKRVYSASVTLQKLDKIPGAMGVSLYRCKNLESQSRSKQKNKNNGDAEYSLVYIPREVSDSKEFKSWIKMLEGFKQSAAILLDPLSLDLPMTLTNEAKQRIQMSSIDQHALMVSSEHGPLSVVNSKSELRWTAKTNKLFAICPSQFVLKAVSRPPDIESQFNKFILWFAKEIGTRNVYLASNKTGHEMEFKKDSYINVSYLNLSDWNPF